MTVTALVVFTVGVLSGMAVISVGIRFIRYRDRLRRRQRFQHAADAERHAVDVLTGCGFVIVEEQARRETTLYVDGEPVSYTVIADFLVQRCGRTAVVEVKTGRLAVLATTTATRRQLREYQAVYGVDDIYLLNADSEELVHVAFEPSEKRTSMMLLIVIALVLMGVWLILEPLLS